MHELLKVLIQKNTQLKPFISLTLLFVGITAIITADQFLKYKIRHLGGFYVCNKGISFDFNVSPIIFWLFLGLFLIFSFFYIKKLIKKALFEPLLVLALVFLLGGALSNSLDRIFLGCVTDFFSIHLSFFPFFNLADIFIFLGSLSLFILISTKKELLCA